MKGKLKASIKIMLLSATLILLTGCLSKTTDELYLLPQPSEEYLLLQAKINGIINAGAEYSAPISGNSKQSVQLEDLDGDGIKEALAFFNVSKDEKPLKICVFKNTGDSYEIATVIEGYGTAIESILYADLNGDSAIEIIVGWQMNTGLQMLAVYSMKDLAAVQFLTTDYTGYSVFDISGDSISELMVLRYDDSAVTGELEMYVFLPDGDFENSIAPLSKGVRSINRMKTGYLINKEPALIIEGSYESDNIITDIFACRKDKIINVTLNGNSGVSENTIRRTIGQSAVYTRDINSDGVWEVPITRVLPSPDNSTSYWVLDWYAYSIYGGRTFVTTTYHNYSDSWYLVLPDNWNEIITVSRRDTVPGERAVVFSLYEDGGESVTDVLVIYYLSGDNKETRAKLEGRFVIREDSEVIYAAEILVDNTQWELAMTEEDVKSNFSIIYSEWVSGLT